MTSVTLCTGHDDDDDDGGDDGDDDADDKKRQLTFLPLFLLPLFLSLWSGLWSLVYKLPALQHNLFSAEFFQPWPRQQSEEISEYRK